MGGGAAAAGTIGQCSEAAFVICLLNHEQETRITEQQYGYLLFSPNFKIFNFTAIVFNLAGQSLMQVDFWASEQSVLN